MPDLSYIDAAQEVRVTGQDSSGNRVNYVTADTNGNLFVRDYADGPVTPGTAALVSSLAGAQFNTTLPTVTTGQQVALQVDATGRLLISSLPTGSNLIGSVNQGTSPWVENVAQFGGSAVVTGTGVSGAGIPRVTVSSDSNILATQSGTWTVQQGATPTAVANAWPFKLTDGTSTTAVKAASTAPVATDPAAVVVVSPNGNQATAANQASEITLLTSIQSTSNSTAVNTSGIQANQTNGTQRTLVTDLVGNLQPSGDAPARAIVTKISDGTNTSAVKAASTAPAATDPALVVGLSPNGNQSTAANQNTQITQLSSIFTAQADGTQKSKIVDASGNTVTTTTINSKQRLDVDLAAEGVDGATAPFDTLQTGGKDKNGNLQTDLQLTTGEKFVRDVLDVGGQNRAQSVTTTAAEALGGATILTNRKVLTIRPTNGIIYWGFTSGVTTATGTPIFTNEPFTISVTDNVHVFVIAAQTTDVRIAEAA